MPKNKTRSKAYACFMSGGIRVLEIFLEWYETLTEIKPELSTVKI